MATDLAVFLHRFLTSHLAGVRGCSPNTIASYRDTFKILIGWFAGHRSVPPEKLTLDHVDAAAVTDFLGRLYPGKGHHPSHPHHPPPPNTPPLPYPPTHKT